MTTQNVGKAPRFTSTFFATTAIARTAYATLAILLMHVVRPDHIPASHMVSDYAVDLHGWVITTAFLAMSIGCLMLGLARSGPSSVAARLAALLLGITSIGLLISAIFPTDPHDLYIKKTGGDESGLGITGTSDHEIEPGAFIQLDFSSLANAGATTGFLTIGSVQSGEGYNICASSSSGTNSGTCFTGSLDDAAFAFNFSKSAPFIDISSTTGDVLLSSASVATSDRAP